MCGLSDPSHLPSKPAVSSEGNCVAVTTQNISAGEKEGILTWLIGTPAILTTSPSPLASGLQGGPRIWFRAAACRAAEDEN